MKEQVTVCILNSAGEGSRRHLLGLFAAGSRKVVRQNRHGAIISARHLAGHGQPMTHRFDIHEAGDPLMVVDSDVRRALLESKTEILEAGHLGNVREWHPHALAPNALAEILREEVVILLQGSAKTPAWIKAIK